MNFSAYSIKNPLVAILLFTLLTLGGILAFKQMKIQQFPDIDMPAVMISVGLSGASPVQLENDVAKKIENKLTNIEGVKHIRTTIQTGVVSIHTEFNLEKDIQEALDDVRSAVSEVRSDLPATANEPIISKVSTAGMPVVSYSVASDGMDDSELSWWVDDTLNKRLSDLQGVGKISRIGGIQRQIIVAVDPDKLGAYQEPISSLSQKVFSLWQDQSGGESKAFGGTQTIRILGAGSDIDDLTNLQIPTKAGTALLGNIAHIYDGASDPSSQAWLGDTKVVAFNVTRSRGASEVSMVNDIDAELAKLNKEYPHITIHKIYDHAEPIYEDYRVSLQMLIEGCILAVVVVFLFLGNWRATFVAATALPLSIIPTFLLMGMMGYSLNIISLLALSLVIGVLVDDAIVEVENIMRHLRMGKTPYEAAMEAADEIGLAVVATTLTLIAVFLPTAFLSGVVGQFFKQFGWTASIAIFISLLVARLITPMMAAYVLKPEAHKVERIGKVMKVYLSWVAWTLRHRLVTLVLTLVVFVSSLMLVKFLPVAFIPDDDTNQTQVTLEMTPDAKLDDTVRVAKLASHAIFQVAGVDSVFVAAGSAGSSMDSRSSGGDAVNIATLDIGLKPRGERPSKSDIESQISTALQGVAGARFKVGLAAGGEAGYNFSLTGANPKVLKETVDQVVRDINALGSISVTTNQALPKPELSVSVDRLAMADKGVSTLDLATVLRIATVGDYEQNLPKLNLDTRQIPIVIRLPDSEKGDLARLENLYLPSQDKVQVGQVAKLEFASGPSEVIRLDRSRSIKITANSDMALGELVTKIKALPSLANLPDGITMIEEGQAESMNELFSGFIIAMGVGVICIFGVLMLLFHKVLQPLTILMALPLSIGGAFIGLLVTGSSLSMPSMIGFIMLMGIATKNSILLVDYAIIATEQGKNRQEAIMDACQKRARPIIMTTVAMGVGMLPLVFGWGGADPTFRQPMAIAVLGGLITSTLLSLVVIPVVYTLMDDVGRFGKRGTP